MDPVASYMLVAFRGYYASRLISEVVRKTTVPYELLVWLNVEDNHLEGYIKNLQDAGNPIRIVGKTPENIGMCAFNKVIPEARGKILVQLEDDVIHISRHAVEIVDDIFNRYPEVKMVGAHVWQDEFTTGARPPINLYNPMVPAEGLYEGPMDGGFTFYRRDNIPLMVDQRTELYYGLGVSTHLKLIRAGLRGWLSLKVLMFHIHGPIYHSYFPGMLDFEIRKYRRIRYLDIAQAYEDAKPGLPPREVLGRRLEEVDAFFETFDFHDIGKLMAHYAAMTASLPPVPARPPEATRVDAAGRRGWWHYCR